MNREAQEFSLEKVLGLLTSINNRATNININILETQKVIIESLKGGYNH